MTDKPSDDKLAAESGRENSTGGITRRDLLYLGGLTAGALAIPTVLQNLNPTSATTAPRDRYEADVLVVGSGFAGVFAAVEAAKMGQRVVLVDKGTVGWSGMTPWASDSRPFDPELYDRKEWLDNLSTATEWLYNRPWIERFMDESMDIFWTLRGWGTHDCRPFERSTVFRSVLLENNVELVERVMLTKLVQDDSGRVGGAVGFTFDDSSEPSKAVVFNAKAVILATGAGSYKAPGFPIWSLTFDGDAMAYDAGAYITGKEFHDTHGTRSTYPAASYNNWTWAQAVTGAYVMVGPPNPQAGGLTLQRALGVHARGGVNARADGGGPGAPGAGRPGGGGGPGGARAESIARNRAKYEGRGFLKLPDLTIDWGDVPGQDDGHEPPPGHAVGGATFGMGVHKGEGVFSHNDDYSCQADGVEGLYAAGDALGSMMVGTAYPGRGFSSYGSAIQGRRAGRFAAEYASNVAVPQISSSAFDAKIAETWAPREVERGYTPAWVIRTLQNTMSPIHVLYIKSQRRLDGALASIEYLREHVVPKMIARDGHELRVAHEAANMLLNAEMKLRAGLYRKESRGTHFIEEYPARDDRNWLCWVLQRKENGRMVESKYPLPADWGPPRSMAYRERYPREFPGEDKFLRDNPDWMET
jgi:succinate dehydrogenase/fumarate reductase flavoprotein subunit